MRLSYSEHFSVLGNPHLTPLTLTQTHPTKHKVKAMQKYALAHDLNGLVGTPYVLSISTFIFLNQIPQLTCDVAMCR